MNSVQQSSILKGNAASREKDNQWLSLSLCSLLALQPHLYDFFEESPSPI